MAKKKNKELILKALSDPKFRKLLVTDPAKALGKERLTELQEKEVEIIVAAVKGVESQINLISDKLLCACGVIV